MKGQIKLLCVTLAVIFTVSLCTLQVFATPDEVSTDPTVVTVAPTETTVPPTEATVATTQPTEVTVPPTEATINTTRPTQAPSTTAPTTVATPPTSYNTVATDPPVTVIDTNPNEDYTPQSDLYDTDGKRVDTDNLKKSDWEEIAEKLQNADDSNSGDDFGFIQNNDGSDDNGLWLLITGVCLVILGVAIIIALIVLKIRRKNNKNNKGTPSSKGKGTRDTNKKPTPAEQRQVNRRSKYDTADVFIPRRTPPRGDNRYSGTRYKPKH